MILIQGELYVPYAFYLEGIDLPRNSYPTKESFVWIRTFEEMQSYHPISSNSIWELSPKVIFLEKVSMKNDVGSTFVFYKVLYRNIVGFIRINEYNLLKLVESSKWE